MPDDTKPEKITPADRAAAIKEYMVAKTKADKSAVVKKYPFLSHIFSAVNHS